VTVLCSILVTVLMGSFLLSPTTRLERLERPDESLERLVSRDMDLRDALGRAPGWEQAVYRVLWGDEDPVNDSIGWYEELTGLVDSPLAQLERVILLAEAGQATRLSAAIIPWEFRGEDTTRMKRWVRAAYLGTAPSPDEGRRLIDEVRENLPSSWFADVLVAHIAAGIGDRAIRAEAQTAIADRGMALLNRRRALAVGEIVLLVLCVVMLRRFLTRGAEVRVGEAPIPPCWTMQDGYGLFIRGVFGFLFINALVSFGLPKETPFEGVATLAAGTPFLWWTTRYLTAKGVSVPAAFGLRSPAGGAARVAGVTVVLMGLSVMGEAVIALAEGIFNIKTHWADGLMENMIWGSSWLVAGEALDSIVWAPLVEEIAFRGVLFGTLRTRMGVWPAVLASAAIFAFVHGYSVVGFASVFWSGILWALAYERTRSLWPGMLAHGVNNLLVTGEFIWLVRI
jgi:membrane protease YdiL (CAAX protease family)